MRTQTAGEDRGLRRSRFAVLRQAPCPAVLVECGFLTHPVSEELLRADWYRDLLAEGLAAGLLDYRRQVEAANPPAAPGPAAAGR
jgi:N-acetylmuramoyl-L-alanine amidase